MEPQSDMSSVQPGSWRQYITALDKPRKGQMALWDTVASAIARTMYFAVMCTGYGKTLAACGVYAIARAQKRADRVLILVPNDNLRKQWSNGAKRNMQRCGITIVGAYEVAKEPRDLRYAEDKMAEVFVATYQQAMSDPQFWDRLLSLGKWLVVYDECHHLSTDGVWGKATHSFDSALRLYLTATPMRHDRRMLLGIPKRALDDGRYEYVPDVRIDYADGLVEEAVRPIRVHEYHYFVDVELPDGKIDRITTATLRAEGVTDWLDYEKKRELRYKEKYLSPIFNGAVAQLDALDAIRPGQHQMVVFAMSCRHAAHVARVLNTMPDKGPNYADWIGDDRRDAENEAILEAFAEGKLKCLVQIDKVGEGFDNARCSVGVFLHLIRSATKNTQQIGRLVRRNIQLPWKDDRCHILTSADAPVLPLALDFERSSDLISEEHETGPERDRDRGDRGLVDIKPATVVNAEFDRVDVHHVGSVGPSVDEQKAARGATWLRSNGIPNVEMLPLDTLIRVADSLTEKEVGTSPASELFATVTGEIAHEKERVKKVVGVFARNVVTLRAEPAGDGGELRFERSLIGDTIRIIHAQWLRANGVSHEVMTAVELRRKYEWIRKLNEELRETRKVPGWLLV